MNLFLQCDYIVRLYPEYTSFSSGFDRGRMWCSTYLGMLKARFLGSKILSFLDSTHDLLFYFIRVKTCTVLCQPGAYD